MRRSDGMSGMCRRLTVPLASCACLGIELADEARAALSAAFLARQPPRTELPEGAEESVLSAERAVVERPRAQEDTLRTSSEPVWVTGDAARGAHPGLARESAQGSGGAAAGSLSVPRRHKLAVLVPYRDRESMVDEFMHSVPRALNTQNIEHEVFFVEQADRRLFNRGALLNAGVAYIESLGEGFDYVAVHDVDTLPTVEGGVLYAYPSGALDSYASAALRALHGPAWTPISDPSNLQVTVRCTSRRPEGSGRTLMSPTRISSAGTRCGLWSNCEESMALVGTSGAGARRTTTCGSGSTQRVCGHRSGPRSRTAGEAHTGSTSRTAARARCARYVMCGSQRLATCACLRVTDTIWDPLRICVCGWQVAGQFTLVDPKRPYKDGVKLVNAQDAVYKDLTSGLDETQTVAEILSADAFHGATRLRVQLACDQDRTPHCEMQHPG